MTTLEKKRKIAANKTIKELRAELARTQKKLRKARKSSCVDCAESAFEMCCACGAVLCNACVEKNSRGGDESLHPGKTRCEICFGHVCQKCEVFCSDCASESESTPYLCKRCNKTMKIDVKCDCKWYTCGKHEKSRHRCDASNELN